MTKLLLFVGPTRTASTSLFHWQISHLSLYSKSNEARVDVTKAFAEEHYYFDPNYKKSPFRFDEYASKFRDRSADVFVDYAPTIFHAPIIFDQLISFLASSFESVFLICTVRDYTSLVNSCFRYNLRAKHPSFTSSTESDIQNYAHQIAAYFDYFAFNDKISKLVANYANINLSYISFSALVSRPNEAIYPFIESLFDFDLRCNSSLYCNTSVVHNSSDTKFIFQDFYKYLSPVKPLLVPLFSKIRKYIPSTTVKLSDQQSNTLAIFSDCFDKHYSGLSESQILSKLNNC